MSKLIRSLLLSGAVVAGVAACGDDVTVTPPPAPVLTVHSISVAPSGVNMTAGTTLQMSAAVNADAGVATTVTWTSSSTLVTVSGSGLVTAPASFTGSVAITACSTVNTSVCGVATITVVAVPTATVTSVTVTPPTVSIQRPNTGSTPLQLAASVQGANNPSQTVTWTQPAGTSGILSVSASGLVTIASTSAGGTVVVSGCSTVAGYTSVCGSSAITVTIGAPAQISINSITAANVPVNINNVAGQIDVNLNFDPGVQSIDSVVVRLTRGGTLKTAAKQNFGATVPAAGIITLSVNTANFVKNATTGVAAVDWFNGPTTVQAQVFPTGTTPLNAINCQIAANDPSCSSPQALVFNNVDGWAATIAKPARATLDVGGSGINAGTTYWGGPTVGATNGNTAAQIFAVVYNNNPAFAAGSALNRCTGLEGVGCITTVTWTVGSPNTALTVSDGSCGFVTQTALPFARTYGYTTAPSSAQTSCVGYENTTATRNNVVITAAIDGTNNPYTLVGNTNVITNTLIPNATVFGSTPDSLRMDYAGPTVGGFVVAPTVLGSEGFNWVNHAWAFMPAGTKVGDAGVGPVESSWAAFASANGGSATTFPTAITTGADLAETNQNCTGAGCDGYNARATANDLLLNPSNSAVTAAFGDDRTSPLLRYSSALTAPVSTSPLPNIFLAGGTSSTLDSVTATYHAIDGLYGVNVATAGIKELYLGTAATSGTAADSMRIESLDNRSGLSRAVVQSRRFAQGGATGTSVNTGCQTSAGAFGASFGDGYRPGPQVHVTCGSALAGYYTTTMHSVDRAGNSSGVTTSPASASAGAGVNPSAPAAQNANLFYRRTLALDPTAPAVTGVSPNNNYTGNSSQTWSLGSQDDLEVIDTRLRIQYPNVGDGAAAPVASPGLVWSYALSNTFMGAGNSAGPATGNGANLGFFAPIATRFDASIVNPQVTAVTQDLFTLNVQETCVAAAAPAATCLGAGDPISIVTIPLAKPNNLAVQVRDVFGSWIFNTGAAALTGVSAEFVSPILPATVAAPGSYTVGYSVLAPGCPQWGGAPGASCVTSGVNFRQDGAPSGSTRNFRAVENISVTLPLFTRVELFGLNVANEWVFIQRCTVPGTIIPGGGAQSCGGGTVLGTDNGLERYWVFSFTSIPTTGFTQFRALGVNSSGFGLFSTRQP